MHPLSFRCVSTDPLAQLVEHNTFNVGVLGSSPKRITKREAFCLSFLFYYLHDLLQPVAVYVVKGIQFTTVYVEHCHHFARGIEEGYDNFRARKTATGYMTRELLHIRNQRFLEMGPDAVLHLLLYRSPSKRNPSPGG